MTGFVLPPHPRVEGRERRVGVEIEYRGPPPAVTAAELRSRVGGEIISSSPFRSELRGGPYGDFVVEVDARLLEDGAHRDLLEALGIDVGDDGVVPAVERFIERVSSAVVPQELVTPPIPLSKLGLVDELVGDLRGLGAKGTRESIFHAFGVHLNPEVWSRDVRVVRDVMQAFLLLYDALVTRMDLSRRVGPHVSDFPDGYRDRVLRTDYDPDLETFVRDYLEFTPTRNRSLDLLPLLMELCPDGPWHQLREPELVNPRPTFHYRLPDSRVDEPTWAVSDAWWAWVRVETWASRRADLEGLIEDYRRTERDHVVSSRRHWRERALEALLG